MNHHSICSAHSLISFVLEPICVLARIWRRDNSKGLPVFRCFKYHYRALTDCVAARNAPFAHNATYCPDTSQPLLVNCNPATSVVFDAPLTVVRISENACCTSGRSAQAAGSTIL